MVKTRTPPSTSDSASQTSPQVTQETAGDEQPSTSYLASMGPSVSSQRNTSDAIAGGDAESASTSRGTRSSRRHARRRHTEQAIFDACRGIPSSMPVKGESYCDCPKQGRDLKCKCGEEDDSKCLQQNIVANLTDHFVC